MRWVRKSAGALFCKVRSRSRQAHWSNSSGDARRNEAVSYACAAIITRGDIVVENARHRDLTAFLEKLDEVGAGYEIGNYGIRFYKGALKRRILNRHSSWVYD